MPESLAILFFIAVVLFGFFLYVENWDDDWFENE